MRARLLAFVTSVLMASCLTTLTTSTAHADGFLELVAFSGRLRRRTEELAASLGVADRIDFAGAVGEQGLIDLYKGALAVVYTPFDEDYGYVTLESFLAHKPVVTAADSGGPLEFVRDGVNGSVVDPVPEAIATAVNTGEAASARSA